MNIRPVGAELFRADRHDEANSRFLKFSQQVQKYKKKAREKINVFQYS